MVAWLLESFFGSRYFMQLAFTRKINFISELTHNTSSWHLFVIKVDNRDDLHQKLKKRGISTSVHFIPIHKHFYYKKQFSYNDDDYPVANIIYKKSLSLPIYPGLSGDEIEYIIKHVLNHAESHN